MLFCVIYNTVALILVYLAINMHHRIDLGKRMSRVLKIYRDDTYNFNPIK